MEFESFAAPMTRTSGWRSNTSRQMQAEQIPKEEIWEAHMTAKLKLWTWYMRRP